MKLETERLVLRLPEFRDRDGYAEMWGDPEVVRFLGGMTRRPDQVTEGIERMRRHWERHGVGLFSVIRKEDGRFIGRTGYLLWDPKRWTSAMHEEIEGDDLELEIGWAVVREVWNQGYATEAAIACRDHALGPLRWSRVISLIAEQNVASIRVAQKIGERLERENIPGPFEEKVDLYALEASSHGCSDKPGDVPHRAVTLSTDQVLQLCVDARPDPFFRVSSALKLTQTAAISRTCVSRMWFPDGSRNAESIP